MQAMTPRRATKPSRLSAVPSAGRARHVYPSEEHLALASAYLRQQSIPQASQPLLTHAVGLFGWAETEYVREARAQGEQSEVWETARWIVANALAREEHAAT